MLRELIKRQKLTIACLGDVGVFFLSIVLVLYLRYGPTYFGDQFSVHLVPFVIVFCLWFIIFYISNLYTYKAFSNILEIAKSLITAILISFSVTITIFYIFSRFFSLTPKANLVLFAIIFGILDILWRYILRKAFIQKQNNSNILILGASPLVKTITEYVSKNPQLGYALQTFNTDMTNLSETIKKKTIDLIVINGQSLKNRTASRVLYRLLPNQIEITTLTDFYEELFSCIPLSEIEEEWFVRELTKNKAIYDSIKRLTEIILSGLGLLVAIPFFIIISLLIAVTSRGSIIYRQERMGKGNIPFTLYKFRTMKDREVDGSLWATENDERITFAGKILRRTHLDEIPQLINIFKGDISFVGPRPERTKLVKIYEEIPYYEIRHIIKPGVTGWAQLNYKPSASLDEAKNKFQFDLYYLKNRSFILDIFIILKTIRMVFLTNK